MGIREDLLAKIEGSPLPRAEKAEYASAPWFDLTGIEKALWADFIESPGAYIELNALKHVRTWQLRAERVFAPAAFSLLVFPGPRRPYVASLRAFDDHMAFAARYPEAAEVHFGRGFILVEPDLGIVTCAAEEAKTAAQGQRAITLGMLLVVALRRINSPHPAARVSSLTPIAPRAERRRMERAGIQPLPQVTWTTVKIAPEEEHDETGASRTHTPHARHLCRSHLRTYHNGKTVRVKAHYRGNEAYGIRNHNYVIEGSAA